MSITTCHMLLHTCLPSFTHPWLPVIDDVSSGTLLSIHVMTLLLLDEQCMLHLSCMHSNFMPNKHHNLSYCFLAACPLAAVLLIVLLPSGASWPRKTDS